MKIKPKTMVSINPPSRWCVEKSKRRADRATHKTKIFWAGNLNTQHAPFPNTEGGQGVVRRRQER